MADCDEDGEETVTTAQVCVSNRHGIHARPAAAIVRTASEFSSGIWLQIGTTQVNAKSALSLLTLGATQGTVLELRCQGRDAQAAARALVDLFAHGLSESDDGPTSTGGGLG